ncbi:hypothetical protein [Conchiformibius kuhniae]|uniref:Uncharacterized protein n=1 Tax=Conchiformibius kuhniae TaxID=211502 RepID=A0A8T9MUR1_9NEIS|nr:hypothetical protein [Conchiformibius kuhniae]UOP04236.1 hypothetical protein LVJ77_07430 [Conchiformibius kuhniae]
MNIKGLLITVFAVCSAGAIAAPKFADYPVKIYTGKRHLQKNPETRLYRTTYRKMRQAPIAFAGKYTYTVIGCGVACFDHRFLNVATGKPYEFDLIVNPDYGCADGTYGYVRMRPDSRLLEVRGGHELYIPHSSTGICQTVYFLEKNGKLIRLK